MWPYLNYLMIILSLFEYVIGSIASYSTIDKVMEKNKF